MQYILSNCVFGWRCCCCVWALPGISKIQTPPQQQSDATIGAASFSSSPSPPPGLCLLLTAYAFFFCTSNFERFCYLLLPLGAVQVQKCPVTPASILSLPYFIWQAEVELGQAVLLWSCLYVQIPKCHQMIKNESKTGIVLMPQFYLCVHFVPCVSAVGGRRRKQ